MASRFSSGVEESWNKTLFVIGGTVVASTVIYLLAKDRIQGFIFSNKMETDVASGDHEIMENEKISRKVLMLGMENSGKTSILNGLQVHSMKIATDDEPPTPTQGFHVVCIQTGSVELNIWEIGGTEKMRNYWSNFVQDCDVLVYVVDSSADNDSLEKAGSELQKVLDLSDMKDTPLIILANKQDQVDARDPANVLVALKLQPSSLENRFVHQVATQAAYNHEHEGLNALQSILSQL